MTDLLQQGVGSAWLFIPGAISLGALHGLEPGHSKAVMAAFIIAIRGTVGQAIMLGLAAMVSHTAVVWLLAFLCMRRQWKAESSGPYFQLASRMSIAAIAAWVGGECEIFGGVLSIGIRHVDRRHCRLDGVANLAWVASPWSCRPA